MAYNDKPVRKAAKVGVNQQGKPQPAPGNLRPERKTAQPFGSVDKKTYNRYPCDMIAPNKIAVNDKDAGQALHTGKQTADKRGGV